MQSEHPEESTASTQKTFVPYGLTPQPIVSAYSAEQWEVFIQEWLHSLNTKYKSVQRFSGPGDKGRDVVGFVEAGEFSKAWDNYQCKHYDRPLTAAAIWVELGKLVYYTFIGDFSAPRAYKFVAPREVGPSLKDLFAKPTQIAAELIQNWEKYCENGITSTKSIPLDTALMEYIKKFDFSIVGFCSILEIIEGHMSTPHWATRFKVAIPIRPPAEEPPAEVASNEMKYVRKLLDAYGDEIKSIINKPEDLTATPKHANHLKRSRQWFFQAEALNRFSRDHYPVGAFDALKQQVHDGIVDTCEKDFAHGFDRVVATTDRAADLALGNSELAPHAGVGDKKGICHHLANEDKINWVK